METTQGGAFSWPHLDRTVKVAERVIELAQRAGEVTASDQCADQLIGPIVEMLGGPLRGWLTDFAPYARLIDELYAKGPVPPPGTSGPLRVVRDWPPEEGAA